MDSETLARLIKILENHCDHLSILKFNSGWKVVIGTPHLECSNDPRSDYQKLLKIKPRQNLIHALLDCLERGDSPDNVYPGGCGWKQI